MTRYKINKEKCIGCGVCVVTSEGATELGEDGKAKILNQEKLEKNGGETLCPYEAIEKEKNSK
ncbi:MAG: ferredoxin [Patescibacteria group bacterium]